MSFSFIFAIVFSGVAASRGSEPLRVEADVAPAPYFVGQGIELRIRVAGRGQRPKIDLPAIANASAWTIGTDRKPISRSAIGSIEGEENLIVTRIRVVARRPGPLLIPSIPVHFDERSGRSRSVQLKILPVPEAGRPSGFLGGIGRFSLEAEASPKVVRVGQEFDLRVKVSGPAAWGTTERPDLTRYDRLPLGLRIRPGPILTSEEPPERTFIYHLRPSRAGESVLPPLSIVSFDPAVSRYMTQVTPGVPVRVAAVAAFDPAAIVDGQSALNNGRSAAMALDGMDSLGGRVSRRLCVAEGGTKAATQPPADWSRRGPASTPRIWLEACVHLISSSGRQSRVQPLPSRHTEDSKAPITWRLAECAPCWFATSSSELRGPPAHSHRRKPMSGRQTGEPIRRFGSESGPPYGPLRPGSLRRCARRAAHARDPQRSPSAFCSAR